MWRDNMKNDWREEVKKKKMKWAIYLGIIALAFILYIIFVRPMLHSYI